MGKIWFLVITLIQVVQFTLSGQRWIRSGTQVCSRVSVRVVCACMCVCCVCICVCVRWWCFEDVHRYEICYASAFYVCLMSFFMPAHVLIHSLFSVVTHTMFVHSRWVRHVLFLAVWIRVWLCTGPQGHSRVQQQSNYLPTINETQVESYTHITRVHTSTLTTHSLCQHA